MTPDTMHSKMMDILKGYADAGCYFGDKGLLFHADDYVALYRALLAGESVKGLAIKMEISPGEEEAEELAGMLKTPEDFIDELAHTLATLVEMGVVIKRQSHLRLISKEHPQTEATA